MDQLEQRIHDLHAACSECTGCALHKTRTQTVFGVGNPHSPIMLIGEGPGEQ